MAFPVNAFVESLKNHVPNGPLFNPWREQTEQDRDASMPEVRRNLLRHHLNCAMPRLLIVNDTISYYGGRQTGVPLTSEYLVINNRIPRVEYNNSMTCTDNPFNDPTAGAVWQLLTQFNLDEYTLCWSALPFQPFKASTKMNRAPTKDEMTEGADWLYILLSEFPNIPVIGIGARTRNVLKQFKRQSDTIKTPSHGGGLELKQLLKDISSRYQNAA